MPLQGKQMQFPPSLSSLYVGRQLWQLRIFQAKDPCNRYEIKDLGTGVLPGKSLTGFGETPGKLDAEAMFVNCGKDVFSQECCPARDLPPDDALLALVRGWLSRGELEEGGGVVGLARAQDG
jgi:hypothetical protein